MEPIQDLDKRYLDFRDRTIQLFSEYPLLEPLRHFIFRELLIQHQITTWKDFLKHWLRPFVRRAHTITPPEPFDVLIWIETSREVVVDALRPVYRELVSRGAKVQLVSFGGPRDLPAGTLKFFFPAAVRPPTWAKNAWEALCDAFDDLRSRSLERAFLCACANIQSLSDEMERMLDRVRPKIVLTASTQLAGGAALLAVARRRGVLSLLQQHGILQPFYTPLVADYMLTWGPSSNELLIRLGVPHQKLIVAGSPRHDSLACSTHADSRAAFFSALSLPNRPTFLFFSNGNDLVRNGAAPLECARWLENMAAQYATELNVVVRLHPNEDRLLYRDCPHLHITKTLLDLSTTLEGCDWVGSLCSTVLYDALLYRKPVCQFYADGWPELADNWKQGLALRIATQEELSDIAKRMLRDGPRSCVNGIDVSRVFANHGRATQVVADLLQRRLERSAGTCRFHTIPN